MPLELLHSLANISKFKGFLSPVKNILSIFTSIMLHCKREIQDVIQSISNVNYQVFFWTDCLKKVM